MDTPDDLTLLAEFSATRSNEAFALLVARHLPLVRGTATRTLGSSAHADDVAQTTFLLLARKAHTLNPTTHLPAYLHRLAYLTAKDTAKSESRRKRRERATAHPESTPRPKPTTDVDRALAALRPADRELLLTRYWQGLSIAETAAALKTSPDVITKRLQRAFAKLRPRLASTTALSAALQLHTDLPPHALTKLLATTLPRATAPTARRFPAKLAAAAAFSLALIASAAALLPTSVPAPPSNTPPLASSPGTTRPDPLALARWLCQQVDASAGRYATLTYRARRIDQSAGDPERRTSDLYWYIDGDRYNARMVQRQMAFRIEGDPRVLHGDRASQYVRARDRFVNYDGSIRVHLADPDGNLGVATVDPARFVPRPDQMMFPEIVRRQAHREGAAGASRWEAFPESNSDGATIYKLTCSLAKPGAQPYAIYWIDASKGFVCTRRQSLQNGRPTGSTEINYRELSPGLCFATSIASSSWPGTPNANVESFEITDATVGMPVDESRFTAYGLDVPEGTAMNVERYDGSYHSSLRFVGGKWADDGSPEVLEWKKRMFPDLFRPSTRKARAK